MTWSVAKSPRAAEQCDVNIHSLELYAVAGTWEVERGKFYDPVRSLLKSKNQEINRFQLAVKLPWAIFFESVDILS
ncbi:hypothetical protein TNCV_319911 [Trichonephila clavipes]|nr:hypothetical protein TNCV_319911 [Trichonephila clavipes]